MQQTQEGESQSGPSKRNELVGNLAVEPVGKPEGELVGKQTGR